MVTTTTSAWQVGQSATLRRVVIGHDSKSIGALISANSTLLSAKMAERSAETGERYITRNREEYRDMLGKAMGGALGGFTTASSEVIELLRQRSRPYLFSNSLPPHVVAAGIKAFEMLDLAGDLRERLAQNTAYFRERMDSAGFDIKPGTHPISPVMLYDAPLAQKFASRLLEEGIYAIGFFFPVVPQGQARIRTQISAAHTREHLDRAIAAFTKIGRELGVI